MARAAKWYRARPLHVRAWIAVAVIGPIIALF